MRWSGGTANSLNATLLVHLYADCLNIRQLYSSVAMQLAEAKRVAVASNTQAGSWYCTSATLIVRIGYARSMQDGSACSR